MSLSEYADPIEAQAATPQLAAKLAGKMPAIPAHRVTGADILVGKPGAFKVVFKSESDGLALPPCAAVIICGTLVGMMPSWPPCSQRDLVTTMVGTFVAADVPPDVATPLCVRARQCNPFHFRLDQAGQRAAAPGVTFYIRGVPAEMMGIEGVLAEAMQGLPQGTSDVKVAGRWHADSRMTSIKYGIMQMCAVGTAPQPPTDPDAVARVTDMLTAINRGQALSPALRMSLEHQANAVLLEQWFDLLFENPRDNAHAQQLVATMSAARGLFDICPLVTMLAPAATADGARTLGRDEMRALMADVNTGTHGVAVSVPVTVSAFTSSGRTSAPYQMSPPTIAVHGYVPPPVVGISRPTAVEETTKPSSTLVAIYASRRPALTDGDGEPQAKRATNTQLPAGTTVL